MDCRIKKEIYPRLLGDGILAEAFFAVESQSTSRAMELVRYEDLPLAEARAVISPRFHETNDMTFNPTESKFLEILAENSTSIGEALEKLGLACPDVPEETLVHEALALLKTLHQRNLLSFAASKP
ncbi:MAG: hypothetical protein HY073_05580 [Deltaproteobacteria bacterium]|nr:hypothetical protein [Deltaproteobacteria bacterium]